MFTLFTKFIEYNGVLYKILRTLKESNNPIIDDWKEHLEADLVLKKEGILYFLRKIDEAILVEEAQESLVELDSSIKS